MFFRVNVTNGMSVPFINGNVSFYAERERPAGAALRGGFRLTEDGAAQNTGGAG